MIMTNLQIFNACISGTEIRSYEIERNMSIYVWVLNEHLKDTYNYYAPT